jgi:regulator of protease activity HflC (stomatin/prohibitin superfamily)
VNARTIRRAAERKTQKLALKAEAASISEPQLSANRANAQLSTGPRTENGKRISSLNAVSTGLTGQTVLLPSDDAAYYERHVQRFVADHKPETDRESELVQHLADAQCGA